LNNQNFFLNLKKNQNTSNIGCELTYILDIRMKIQD